MHEFLCTCNAFGVHVTRAVVTVHAICEGLGKQSQHITLGMNVLKLI